MVDQDRLETARMILGKCMMVDGSVRLLPNKAEAVDFAIGFADALHEKLEDTQRPDTGHPAETALEQLLSLIADHHDKLLPKWIAANAKHRKLGELVSYLGADIETP